VQDYDEEMASVTGEGEDNDELTGHVTGLRVLEEEGVQEVAASVRGLPVCIENDDTCTIYGAAESGRPRDSHIYEKDSTGSVDFEESMPKRGLRPIEDSEMGGDTADVDVKEPGASAMWRCPLQFGKHKHCLSDSNNSDTEMEWELSTPPKQQKKKMRKQKKTSAEIVSANALQILNNLIPGLRYICVDEEGPAHGPIFTIQVEVDGQASFITFCAF